ncbi:MAG: hypothetical protein Q8L27_00660 [archaeon]|nr:hypothetical protein [archaeon]
MRRKIQRFFGWILFVSGLFLIGSTFVPEMIQKVAFSFMGNDLISIFIGIILGIVGYSGINARW